MDSYPFNKIEPKWQKFWDDNKTFQTLENDNFPPEKRCYVLDMFPYPSGSGLHVGHPEGYTATDIYSRYLRMNGYNVLHPMGFDSFGLPAENYAINTGQHPRKTTEKNITHFIHQIRSLGFSYDWDRMVETHSPEYYRWTQWIFLQLYKKGLAYESRLPINWCSGCKTGLANEEVKDGLCERCGNLVQRRNVRQWVLRITDYAEELLTGLQDLDWPESIKSMQRNWIGRSEGTDIYFQLAGEAAGHGKIKVYSTRPDTLFGATYLVLAPEHPLVRKICTPSQKARVEEYITVASHKSDLERTNIAKSKSGVFTGACAVNPVTQKEVPVWISDYILISYGTGAIMAVPAHDQRDWEFAQTFNLPIVEVLEGGNIQEEAFTGDGPHINSDFLNGLNKTDAIETINAHLESCNKGKKTVNFKLRDWIFSRQRYWGEPIPLVHCPACGTLPLEEKDLPLLLPEVESYKPTGEAESPLANVENWVNTPCPKCGRISRRETNTMPQWAGSCWYYLRYIDPHNTEYLVSKTAEKYWMPVNLYIGGAEHAVLHLLYARFWHRVLHDLKIVSHPEPFSKLVNQGMITSFAYLNKNKSCVPMDKVKKKGKTFINTETGEEVKQITAKMSKSLKNVINPDDIIQQYGADSIRIYEMFMGPLEVSMPWQTTGLIGVHRFLNRVWNIAKRPLRDGKPGKKLVKELHKTIKKVDMDTRSLNFNTAISQMMIFINIMYGESHCWRAIWEPFVLIFSPYAPHLGEEMWEMLGHKKSLAYSTYPAYNPNLTQEEKYEIVIQINGKLRARITVPAGTCEEELIRQASAEPKVSERLSGKSILKTIVIINKIVNFVVR